MDAAAAGPRGQPKDPAVLAERALAALRCPQARPTSTRALRALGWCLGGRAAVALASMRPAVRAAVSFHGFRRQVLREASRTDEPPPGLLLCPAPRTRSSRPSTPGGARERACRPASCFPFAKPGLNPARRSVRRRAAYDAIAAERRGGAPRKRAGGPRGPRRRLPRA